jgi:hypothetical protein
MRKVTWRVGSFVLLLIVPAACEESGSKSAWLIWYTLREPFRILSQLIPVSRFDLYSRELF